MFITIDNKIMINFSLVAHIEKVGNQIHYFIGSNTVCDFEHNFEDEECRDNFFSMLERYLCINLPLAEPSVLTENEKSDDMNGISENSRKIIKHQQSLKKRKLLKKSLLDTELAWASKRLVQYHDVYTLGDLIKLTGSQVESVRGFGKSKVNAIKSAVEYMGLKFKEEK